MHILVPCNQHDSRDSAVHGGEHGKRSCINTPVKLMYPKLRANTGRVPGGAKKKRTPEHTTGAPKWIMP